MEGCTSRRGLLLGAATALVYAGRAGAVAGGSRPNDKGAAAGVGVGVAHESVAAGGAAERIAALEKREGGLLGVAAFDTGSGRLVHHRGNDRFGMCSVFKFLAVAAVLQRVDQGKESLGRWVTFSERDLLEYAPVAKNHTQQQGMPLGDLCAAAVQWSDNTAANLVLKSLGGPAAVTQFIRSLGDQVTRLDDIEPGLNVAKPGDLKNSSTPLSMSGLLSTVLLGKVLSDEMRSVLEQWMLDAQVGEKRLPAGLPAGWQIAHKTGTWEAETNDAGIIWPPNRAPIVVTAFYWREGVSPERREGVLCEVGKIIAAAGGKTVSSG